MNTSVEIQKYFMTAYW